MIIKTWGVTMIVRRSFLLCVGLAAFILAGCGGGGSTAFFTVGGTVSGLGTGEKLILQNNLTDDLEITKNGPFTFATPLATTSRYDVTVLDKPLSKTCSVGNNEGTIKGYNITDVTVVCDTKTYTVGGALTGLSSGENSVLQLNLDDDLKITADGNFVFDALLADGSPYEVTVSVVPDNKFYNLSKNKGVLSGGNISDVGITLCSLSSMKELKRLTAESVPPIPDLDTPIAIHAVGDKMVVVTAATGRSNGTVYLINPATYKVLSSHAAGYQPGGFTVVADSEIWVINNNGTITVLRVNGDSLELIDAGFVVTTVEGSLHLNSITTDMNGNVWVVNEQTEIWKIDPVSRRIIYGPVSIAALKLEKCFSEMGSIAVDSVGYLWVGQWCSNDLLGFITKIDTDTNFVLTNVKVGNLPRGMTADADGNVFVATNSGSDYSIDRVSTLTNKVTKTVIVTYGQAMQMTMDLYGKYIWAATYFGDRDGVVGIFDARTLEEKPYVSSGKYSYSIAVDPYGKIWSGNIYPDTEPPGGSISIIGCP